MEKIKDFDFELNLEFEGNKNPSEAFIQLAKLYEKLIDFDKSLNDGAIDFSTFQPGGWRLTRYTESGNFDNDKKL